MPLVPRLKSVGANLVIGVCSLFLWAYIWGVEPLMGVLLLFMVPIGLFHLYRAVTWKLEPEFLPREPTRKVRIPVPNTGDAREDNRRAFTEMVRDGGMVRRVKEREVDFMTEYFGDRRWDGCFNGEVFAGAVDAYIAELARRPFRSVNLTSVESTSEVGDPILKARLAHAPNTDISQRFKARANFHEVGFVVLDVEPESDSVIIVELFVTPDKRGEGFGTSILGSIEDYALSEDRHTLRLRARSLDPDSLSDAELEKWYVDRGYSLVPGVDRVFEKSLLQLSHPTIPKPN